VKTTKKELEARIAALEAEIALLRARPTTVPYYPPYWNGPHWWQITGSGSISSDQTGAVTWNSELAQIGADALMEQFAGVSP